MDDPLGCEPDTLPDDILPLEPYPEWVKGFREDQVSATEQVVSRFEDGARVVFLDAPTGAGKTLIAEMVRRELGVSGIYVCSGKQLQEQFLRDYPYAKVLKGRSNYSTELMPRPYNGADCEGKDCRWCYSRKTCPYQIAKNEAFRAQVAVLNTSYLLAEVNSQGGFGQRKDARPPFTVIDECDTLEASLMGYVELKVGPKLLAQLGMRVPVKGARVSTVRKWLQDLDERLAEHLENLMGIEAPTLDQHRERVKLGRLLEQVRSVDLGEEDEEGKEVWGDWIRDYSTSDARGESLVLKPVVVDRWAPDVLWRHADQWLCMSATIISAQEQAMSLGLDRAGIPWDVVSIGMRFPVEHRKIVVKPVANMTYRTEMEERPKLAEGVRNILGRFPQENVLIHTVSYKLAAYLWNELAGCQELGDRALLTYTDGHEREEQVVRFRRKGGVLLAPSLERGVDLPDEMCRVVIVAKIPFPSLGDRRVAERIHRPGGQIWYGVSVARGLVQMTGRGVRHEQDWATTFVLDRQFGRWWSEIGKKVLPKWWQEAITGDQPS